MTQEQNQKPKVKLGTSDQNTELEQPTVTAEELPNVNSKTASQIFATSGEDFLKSLARLMIVNCAWSISEISERKYSNHQGN